MDDHHHTQPAAQAGRILMVASFPLRIMFQGRQHQRAAQRQPYTITARKTNHRRRTAG
jgi:hypothetical protein